VDIQQAAKAMLGYYENGFRTFDMADHYGSSEEIAGYFKKHYNLPDVKLYTKWVPIPGLINEQIAEEAVYKALKKLNSEKIDLLQFHAWNYSDPNWLNALFALYKLQEKGLIDEIGLTNFDHAHLNMIIQSGIPVASNQIAYSLLDQRASHEMTDVCLKHQVKLFAYGTVAGGFFSEKWLGQPEMVADEV
jgi:aryl-alcohol dehydrogenase-like predicted oxidoreductase